MRRDSLDMAYCFIDTVLWVYFDQQMHVVRHYFHFDYISVDTFSGFDDQLL